MSNRFLKERSNDPSEYVVVKTPCTTNGSPYRGKIYCENEDAVYRRVERYEMVEGLELLLDI